MEKTLFERTRELLINRPVWMKLPKMAEELDVSVSWLSNIISGKITDPGVNATERLYRYLSGKPLQY